MKAMRTMICILIAMAFTLASPAPRSAHAEDAVRNGLIAAMDGVRAELEPLLKQHRQAREEFDELARRIGDLKSDPPGFYRDWRLSTLQAESERRARDLETQFRRVQTLRERLRVLLQQHRAIYTEERDRLEAIIQSDSDETASRELVEELFLLIKRQKSETAPYRELLQTEQPALAPTAEEPEPEPELRHARTVDDLREQIRVIDALIEQAQHRKELVEDRVEKVEEASRASRRIRRWLAEMQIDHPGGSGSVAIRSQAVPAGPADGNDGAPDPTDGDTAINAGSAGEPTDVGGEDPPAGVDDPPDTPGEVAGDFPTHGPVEGYFGDGGEASDPVDTPDAGQTPEPDIVDPGEMDTGGRTADDLDPRDVSVLEEQLGAFFDEAMDDGLESGVPLGNDLEELARRIEKFEQEIERWRKLRRARLDELRKLESDSAQ